MGMQLYFLFYSQIKLEGIFLSKFIAPSAIFVILIPYLVRHIKVKIEKVEIIDIIKFSFPLMMTGIVSVLLNSVNRFILGFVDSQDDVGLFSLASNISGVITALLISPFQLAFNVIFWQKLKDENSARFYTKSMTYTVFLYVWGALTLSLTIPYLIKLYIPKNMSYWGASDLIPILSLSLVFYGMLTISYMSYHHAKRNDLIFYFQTGALVLNIALNYLLIPHFKMYGAAFSTFVSFGILIMVMYKFSSRFYFIKYETYKITMMIILAASIMCLFQFMKFDPKWLDIGLRIFLILFYPFMLYFFKLYEEIEIASIKSITRKYLKINVR
jgi:O-antigen/teichoic acid export membrane protein